MTILARYNEARSFTEEFLFVSSFCFIHLIGIYGYIECPYDKEPSIA